MFGRLGEAIRAGRSAWVAAASKSAGGDDHSRSALSDSVQREMRETEEFLRRGVGPFSQDSWFGRANRINMGATELEQPYAQHPWIYAAVRVMATRLASVPIVVYRGTRDDREFVEDHPLCDLFERVNPEMVQSQLIEHWVTLLSLDGEVHWVMLQDDGKPVKHSGILPDEIYPFGGRSLQPVLNESQTAVEHYELQVGKRTLRYLPHQVLSFKLINPYDLLRGLPQTAPISITANSDHLASIWNRAFFENSAEPGGILSTEQKLDAKRRSELQTSFEEKHRGANNRGKTAVMDGGLSYQELGSRHRDLEFRDLKEISREEIGGVMDVNPFELGLIHQVNRETALQSRRQLWEDNLAPKMRYFRTVTNQRAKLWETGDHFSDFDLSAVPALQRTTQEKLEEAKGLRDLGYPSHTINEKLDLGMPEIDGGDTPLVPSGFMPLEFFEDLPDDGSLPGAPSGPPDGPEDDGPDDDAPKDEEPDEEPGDREESAPRRETGKSSRRRRADRVLAAFEVESKAIFPGENRLRKDFKAHWLALRKDQLDRLRIIADGGVPDDSIEVPTAASYAAEWERLADVRVRLSSADISLILFNLEKWNRELDVRTMPSFGTIASNAADQLERELGGFTLFTAQDPAVLEFLGQKQILVRGINVTTRERLRSALLQATSENATVTEMAQRIRREFNFANRRSVTIARTEAGQTTSGVRYRGMTTEGVEQHEWSTSEDEFVRETHVRVDGEIRRLGEAFSNGLLHPSEIGGPPQEVINCRCVALAV